MKTDDSIKQELKRLFFKQNKTSYSKNKDSYSHFKTANNTLKNLANQNEFYEIRKRYKLHSFLEKVLIKKVLNFILFAYYRNQKITIAVMHPVGQQEINHQKKLIIHYAKQLDEFKEIKEVTVFRFDKLNKFSKDFNQETFNQFHKPFKNEKEEDTKEYEFKERSHAYFDNNIKNKKLFKSFEEIRSIIKKK